MSKLRVRYRIRYPKLEKMNILAVLTFLPLLKMGSFSVLFPAIDIMFDYLKILDLLILSVIAILIKKNRIKLDMMFVFTGLYLALLLIVTSVNGGSVFYVFVYSGNLLLIYLWILVFCRMYHAELGNIVRLFMIFMIIDICTKVIYPKGMFISYTSEGIWMSNENWFLGYKNNYFPIIGFAVLIENYKNEICVQKIKFHRYIFHFLCLIEVFWVSKSLTSMIAMMMIFIYYFARKTHFIESKNILYIYIWINVAILLLFVFPVESNIVFLLIGKFLNKNYSMNARFILWRKAIEAFKLNPIFGLGLSAGNIEHPLSNWNAHNRYLWALATGGILGSLILLVLIYMIMRKLYCHYKSKYSHLTGWIIFTILITWQVEVYENVSLFIYGMLIFTYYTCDLITDNKLSQQ